MKNRKRIGALLLAGLLGACGLSPAEESEWPVLYTKPVPEAPQPAAAGDTDARSLTPAEESGEPAPQETAAPEAPAAPATEESPLLTAGTESRKTPQDWETQAAQDISDTCTYNGRPGGPKHVLNDGAYNYAFKTGPRAGVHSIEIAAVGEAPMGALYLRWDGDPVPAAVQVRSGENWVTVAESDGIFFAEYMSFPACRECRLVGRDSLSVQLRLCELRVMTPGKPGPDIQLWEKPEGKVDLMLIAGHPDDELLWFGGALPYYAGQLGKRTVVICCAIAANLRRQELCDALWACGVRVHPIYLHRLDFGEADVKKVLAKWHAEDEVKGWIIGWFRALKPDVLLLHDVDGEYGHGIHKAASWLGRECVTLAADPAVEPASAARYGTWEVPKTYVHLWPDHQIRLDWKQPLDFFDGKTGLEAAQFALEKHRSQVEHGWKIEDGGELDNALFGLFHSTVGPDEKKNDFFEHLK